MSRPIRIAHLVAALPVGGMEMILAHLVRHAPRDAYESQVWCLEHADRLGEELRAEGHIVEELGRTRRRQPGLFFTIARRLAARQIDILHCHDELSWFYGAGAATLVPSICLLATMHGRRRDISKRHLREQRLLTWRSNGIIAVSEFLKKQLIEQLRLPASVITVILNAVAEPPDGDRQSRRFEARRRLNVPADALVVGSVGELSPVKNLELALEAVARARQAVPLHFVHIGAGALAESLQAKARAFGLDGAVSFAGLRRDVPHVLPAMDFYVCSSHYEGTSLAILEALQQEIPVVATAVGGNPEIVLHGETGLLVPAGDSVAMGAAFVELGNDAALRQRLGASAREFVRSQFHVERMMKAYDRVWRTTLPRRGWRRRAVRVTPAGNERS